jgi:hypothetical protein
VKALRTKPTDLFEAAVLLAELIRTAHYDWGEPYMDSTHVQAAVRCVEEEAARREVAARVDAHVRMRAALDERGRIQAGLRGMTELPVCEPAEGVAREPVIFGRDE